MNKAAICLGILVGVIGIGYLWRNQNIQNHAAREDVLLVGTNAEYPPFSFMRDGHIVGFDIDVAQQVAARLGKRMELKDMPFDALLPKLQLGTLHLLAAGMTATPERAKRVNFTKPYITNDSLLIITRSDHAPLTTLASLHGTTVVVNEGYTADARLSAFPAIKLWRLSSPTEAFLALQTGRADAFVTAQSSVKAFFDKRDRNDFTVSVIPEFSDNYALAISKKYPDLLDRVQHVLDTMEHDGTLAQLRTKWGLS